MAVSSLVAPAAPSPFPTYTQVLNGATISGVSSYTVSGLSAYKKIEVYYIFETGNASDYILRFNSDANINYYGTGVNFYGTTNNRSSSDGTSAPLGYTSSGGGVVMSGTFTVENNDSATSTKVVKINRGAGGAYGQTITEGVYGGTSAISSFTISGTANMSVGKIWVLGVA